MVWSPIAGKAYYYTHVDAAPPPAPAPLTPAPFPHAVVHVLPRHVDPCDPCMACPLQHVWPWLYDDAEDRSIFAALQSQMRFMKQFIEDGQAALHHLEAEVVNAACTDPSEELEKHLVLPLIRERITAAALNYNRAQAENQSANRVGLLAYCMGLPCNMLVLCFLPMMCSCC